MKLSRRNLLRSVSLAMTFALGTLSPSLLSAETGKSPVVVELFTSQGCSSCPPADKLLGELVDKPGIIALTQAVDYWDYLGWKDENARAQHTERQQNYARARGDRRIYTPQMVINGQRHVVGSRRGDVSRSIEQAAKAPTIGIMTETMADVLKVNVAGSLSGNASVKDCTLYLVLFKKAVSVAIKRGENRGRTVIYHNVVTNMRPIGMWHGKAMSIELPLRDIRKDGYDGYAVLLQADVNGLPGPIHGAAMASLR